jgi:hypothetical protein
MARHHSKPGVFDVSKPNRVSPSATSRPIIVGHHPQVSDPMVKVDPEKIEHKPENDTKSIPVAFDEDDKPQSHSMIIDAPKMAAGGSLKDDEGEQDHHKSDEEHEKDLMAHAQTQKAIEPLNPGVKPEDDKPSEPAARAPQFTPIDSYRSPSKSGLDFLDRPLQPAGHPAVAAPSFTQPLHIARGKSSGGSAAKIVKWSLIAVATIALTAFLAIDTGLVRSDVSLPFHIFNKPEVITQPAPSPAPVVAPAPPSNLTKYTVPSTTLSFSYPNEWGTATTASEAGFAARGGGAKPSGDYAYLVSFAGDKDVQIAITSSKYLPPARTPLYYDYLQWCIGTNDNKFYRSMLQFTTAGGIETPSTVVCNQGPLTDATKLDASTIVQLKTKDTDGKTVLGDIYTKNLTGSNLLPVLRVKDSAMTNADAIKKLLTSVKAAPATTAPTSQ